MYLSVILVVFVFLVGSSRGFFDLTDIEDPLSIFWANKNALLQDKLIPCESSLQDGTVVQGICANKGQCLVTKGVPVSKGTCSGFLSTCCIYNRNCGKSTKSKETYFTSTLDVANYRECNYNIQMVNENVCQVRLDFEKLILADPSETTTSSGAYRCQSDQLSVLLYENFVPPICGYNSGQHIYVPIHEGTKSIALSITLSARPATDLVNPEWKIRVRQLECPSIKNIVDKFKNYQAAKDFPLLAPTYALQYYTQRSGYIKTLGFNDQSSTTASHYVSNQQYAIAFKRYRNTCGIRFTIDDTFNFPEDTSSTECIDYFFIPSLGKRCRNSFTDVAGDAAVASAQFPGPIYGYIFAATENSERTEDKDGFKLKYELLTSCT